jgi:subtilase family serine protease
MQSRTRPYDLKDGIVSPFVAAALTLLLFACVAAFAQDPALILPRVGGQTPRAVLDGSVRLVEHYNPSSMLRLEITLTPPHPAEEAQFLEEVQDRTSPLFHQFLSAEDWNARFGPSAGDEQAVVDWAVSQGLTITYRYSHRMAVDVEAQVGVIEKAFGVTIDKYRVALPDGTLGPVKFSADRDPVLPPALSAVVSSVQGLNSFERPEPLGGPEPNIIEPDYVSGPAIAPMGSIQADAQLPGEPAERKATVRPDILPPPSGFYTPQEIWASAAYDTVALMNQGHCCNPLGNSGQSPAQTSIAIAAYAPVSLSDIGDFKAAFPYLALNVETIAVDGGFSCSPSAGTCSGETSQDAEWALAMANSRGSASNTSKIYVYIAVDGSWSSVWNHILEDGKTRVISTSWACVEVPQENGSGCTGSTMQAYDSIVKSLVGQGWTLLAGSGDRGSTGGCSDALLLEYPASDPNVVAAGGTTLELYNLTSAFNSEQGWQGGTGAGSCVANNGGSTGGFSSYWGVPSYQSGMGFKSRAVPDVALNAHVAQAVYADNGWTSGGGTSITAPMMAGFVAQENAYLLSLGNICGSNNDSSCAPVGNANYAMYGEGNRPNAGHYPFYDITTGCGSNDITAHFHLTAYCAHVGFDEVTGWGSPNMLQLAWAINWENVPANGLPSIAFTGPAKNKWYNSNQNVSWTIDDYAGTGGHKPSGIAGFTQGWDSIPADAYSEPNQGGPANSFYSGPQFTNVKTGCLALASGQGCTGGVSQGCHTAHVRGWNNLGLTTGDTTYGPICYDTTPPVTTSGFSGVYAGGEYQGTVTGKLTASDNASGVAATYYILDKGSKTTYAGPFTITAAGTHTVKFWSVDTAGNVEQTNIDTFTNN